MRLVLLVLGWYLVIVGVALALVPTVGKRLTDLWLKDKVHRRWAMVTLALGVVILWAAPASRAVTFIYVFGGLSVLKGIYLLIAPRAQLLEIVRWWNTLPQPILRVWGAVAVGIGAAMLMTL
jgi:uncharacterized protein YjeT (DUF2065 family)